MVGVRIPSYQIPVDHNHLTSCKHYPNEHYRQDCGITLQLVVVYNYLYRKQDGGITKMRMSTIVDNTFLVLTVVVIFTDLFISRNYNRVRKKLPTRTQVRLVYK
jgi:hypothetical protein